jgi:hypothetical protein
VSSASDTQQIQLFPLVSLPAIPDEIGVRVIDWPRLGALTERDGASLLREVRAREMVGQVCGRENQGPIVETKHRLVSRNGGGGT